MPKKEQRIEHIKTPGDELEVLAGLKDTMEWEVIKRWMTRYIENIKSTSFTLNMSDERHRYRHTDYYGQAYGLKQLREAIEGAGREAAKLRAKEEAKKRE